MIQRGYSRLEQVAQTGRFRHFADCSSCNDFYKKWDENEASCHNSESTEFDVIEDSGRTYCAFWNN